MVCTCLGTPQIIAPHGVSPQAILMRPSNILALVYGRPSNWLRFSLDGQNLCESSIQQLDKHSATVTLYIAALHNPAPNISLWLSLLLVILPLSLLTLMVRLQVH